MAAAAGLSAAESRLKTFGTGQALIVTRYDRTHDGGRLHQEDFTQAQAQAQALALASSA